MLHYPTPQAMYVGRYATEILGVNFIFLVCRMVLLRLGGNQF